MPHTHSRGEPTLSPYPELERILLRVNQNLGTLDDDHNPEHPPPVDAHDNYYLKIVGKVKYRGNLPLHALKSIIGDIIIFVTLTSHLSCLPYNTAIQLW